MVLTSVLERLHAAGFTVEAIGGRLKVAPASRLTPEIAADIQQHKAEILAELTEPPVVFDSDSPTWLQRTWCKRYRHRFGWRDVHGCDRCLQCVPPLLSAPVQSIIEAIDGEIVEHDPFLLPDDGDVMEFVYERAGIRQYDAGFDQLEAEKMAAIDWWSQLAARSTC